jgi:hypothetical protein
MMHAFRKTTVTSVLRVNYFGMQHFSATCGAVGARIQSLYAPNILLREQNDAAHTQRGDMLIGRGAL